MKIYIFLIIALARRVVLKPSNKNEVFAVLRVYTCKAAHLCTCARVGVNRATCDSALPTKEEDRKNKEVQEEETDERRHWGRGVGAGTGQEVYG